MLKPAALPLVRESGDIWRVEQDYYRLGRLVHVHAWGFSRADALRNFAGAMIEADYPQNDPFKAPCEILWTLAEEIDSLIVFLAKTQARLMTGKYDK